MVDQSVGLGSVYELKLSSPIVRHPTTPPPTLLSLTRNPNSSEDVGAYDFSSFVGA